MSFFGRTLFFGRGALRGYSALGYCSLGLLFALGSGCKDQQKCDEALGTARKSMQDEFLDMALARQWREHAAKICGAGEALTTLDKEIVDREAALEKAAADAAKKAADDGAAALEAAKALWKEWDDLDDKEKTEKSLAKLKKKADRVVEGLTEAYGKQVLDYNTSKFEKREKRFEDKK